jgi:hypothetical protein
MVIAAGFEPPAKNSRQKKSNQDALNALRFRGVKAFGASKAAKQGRVS